MLASYSEYMHKKAALEAYRAQYPDDVDTAAKVQAVLAGYESKNEIADDDPRTAEQVSALNAPTEGLPSQEEISQELSHDAPAADPRVSHLVSMLDPMSPLQPQALATQPATTHPEGDAGAQDEWLRGPLDNPAGRVIVYDAPLSVVRQKLAENPLLLDGIGLSISPGSTIEKGDSVEQGYQDYQWRQAADAAAKAGKTAYRASKATWLGDGQNASLLDSLSTKLKASALPAFGGLTAFVLGADDAANFGAGEALANAGVLDDGATSPEEQAARAALDPRKHAVPGSKFIGGGNDEAVSGLASTELDDKSGRETRDILKEENSGLHTTGQVAGLAPGLAGKAASKAVGLVSKAGGQAVERGTKGLADWSLSNGLWDAITGTGTAAAKQGVVASTLRGGAAAATDQAIREGVQAGSRYAETGDTGTSLREAGGRVAGAAAPGAVLSSLGSGVRRGASALGEEVRWGSRYGGAPGRVEAQGVEPRLGRGHVAPPVVREAELRGRKEGGRAPLTVLADDLNEPLGDAARHRRAEVERVGEANRAEHYATPEGGQTLPVTHLVETSVDKLRELTSEVPRKGLKGVAKPGAEGPVKGLFNANIEGVSARKTKTGIPLTVDEAQKFLSPEWQEKLDFEKLAQKKGAKVWVTPRRYDAAHADEVIEQLGGSTDEHMATVYEAALKDREGRSWSGRKGGWAEAHEHQAAEEGKARETAKAIGADSPRGPAKAVERLGKSKGQSDALKPLEETAKRAGGDAPEKLKGARVAEDLGDLRRWASLGSQSPRGGQRSLMGLTALGDMAVLRGVHPLTRSLEKMKPGKAAAAARVVNAGVRKAREPEPPAQPGKAGPRVKNRSRSRRPQTNRARSQEQNQ